MPSTNAGTSKPKSLAGWYQYSQPSGLPPYKLKYKELVFYCWLLEHPETGEKFPLYTVEEVAVKLRELWKELIGEGISSGTIAKHLRTGKSYAEREYYDRSGRKRGELWLFSKGIIRGYKVATEYGYRILYGYPQEKYQLLAENFVCKHPPHDKLAKWTFAQLWEGIAEETLHKVREELLKLELWDGSGNYTADNCYRVTVGGKTSYWWFEIHTGSEGYDEQTFIPRLLTAEKRLRGRGRYIVIVPFAKDVDEAKEGIRKYNKKKAVKNGEKPKVELKLTKIIHYRQIEELKEEMGLYKHKKRV